ncbi:XapX domain-containing protein [Escherichia coli]|nr:XapX domain-containing protein [Escherichia coli]
MKDILFSSGVGFGIGALFTIVRLPIPVPNVLPGILSIVFMGNDSNLLIVFYVQIMPDDFVMQLHRF